MRRISRKIQWGFTLAEMVVVMAIIGILGGLAAMLIGWPVQGYVDSARRAGMSDTAETLLHRITYDLHQALPNSARVNGGCSGTDTCYLDFLYVTGTGRYRAVSDVWTGNQLACGVAGDDLDFSMADTCFQVLGPTLQFQAGDQVVVNNLGIVNGDAYSGNTAATDVRRAYAGATGVPVSAVVMTSAAPLPASSPARAFYVVREQVRYICDPASGQLKRYWGFSITTPTSSIPAGGSNALLASNVSACKFSLPQGSRLLVMQLTLTESGEKVSLYEIVGLNDAP